MSKHARKPGYVEFCGTWVSPRGKQIYEALESGKGLQACVRGTSRWSNDNADHH